MTKHRSPTCHGATFQGLMTETSFDQVMQRMRSHMTLYPNNSPLYALVGATVFGPATMSAPDVKTGAVEVAERAWI